MKLFNIFSRRKKMTLKELYAPVLDQMWVCVVNFCPWRPMEHDVVIKKVNITEAHADSEGIYVKSDLKNPFCSYSNEYINGYIDKIEMRYNCSGFFETEEDAKEAYNALMEKWIGVIKSKMLTI